MFSSIFHYKASILGVSPFFFFFETPHSRPAETTFRHLDISLERTTNSKNIKNFEPHFVHIPWWFVFDLYPVATRCSLPFVRQDDVAYYSEPERAVPVSRTPKELPRCETVAAIPDYSGPPVLWLHHMAIWISSGGIIMYRSLLGCYRRDSEYGWG